jgi:hypothetical protein
VTPTAKAGKKCYPYGINMGYTPLTSNGTFSAKAYNADNYNVTVTGSFTTSRTVRGTIADVGYGCPSDTFDITIAPPVSPLSPCEMLTQTHAVKTIGAGVAATITENVSTTTSGTCSMSLARISDLNLVVSTSRATLPVEIGGMPVKSLTGPGLGAMIYAFADGNSYSATIVFHHGSSWAGLTYDYQRAPCPTVTPAGSSCVTKGTQSSINAHLESTARQIFSLI